jgi:putative ABC transport system permease protein
VLSEGLWQRRFGSDPAVLNRPVSLNGESYTVVGILPDPAHGVPVSPLRRLAFLG